MSLLAFPVGFALFAGVDLATGAKPCWWGFFWAVMAGLVAWQLADLLTMKIMVISTF